MATTSTHPAAVHTGQLTPRSIAAMGLLAVMWGLSIPLTKLGLQDTSPTTLTALRFAFAVPPLMAYAIGRHPLPRQALPKVLGLGIVGIFIGQITQALGVAGTSASIGTIVSATIPIFIVLFAALRLRQTVTAIQRLGIATAFAGIAIVALGRGGGVETSPAGVAFMLLSSVAIAIYYVWSVELTVAFGVATVAAWSTLFGFLALIPWAGWQALREPSLPSLQSLAVAAYLGLVVTVAGLFLWLNILRTVPARIAAAVQFLQPLVGVMVSAAMFGDQLGRSFGIGVAAVLLGLWLTLKNNTSSTRQPEAPSVRAELSS
jgi:drug/metabolite transporter (DMT)-like permease